MRIYVHDPQAKLDYPVDWSTWLAGGETITASTWTVPAGITKDSDSFSDTAALAWLSGGTAGQDYTITNHIVTSAGREDDRSIILKCRER